MNKINWTDARIGDSALVTSENKMGVILKDYGRKFHLRFADGLEKTYDASELNFFNTDDDYKRGGSIKKGDVYQWHTVEYDSKKGNNYKVVKNIEITEIDSKGQVIGRVVGTSNQFIIRDPQKNLKSKVSKMETGGDIERGGAHMYIELKDSDIAVYHGSAYKLNKNAKPMLVISSAKKGSWDELWQSIRSIQSSNTDGQKGSAHLYVKLSNGDITVYHGDNVRQFRKLDEDERLFLQKNVRKDSWDRVYNTLMNLKSVKMENGGVVGQEIVFDDSGERNTGVIKEIHEITGNYIVAADDGRTVLAQKDVDVISLGKMRTKSGEGKKRFGFFEDGGNIAKENKEMIDSQTIEARHHVEELSKILTKKNKIEPWVVARMERATTDLSDVTHYLEGKKMAKGGGVDDDPFGTKKEFPLGSIIFGQVNPVGKVYKGKVVGYSKNSDDVYIIDENNRKIKLVGISIDKMATGGGVGSKLKATYIPNRNIDELKTVFGQSIKGKDLIDGAYTTRKGIKQKPKMARTMFEEETYEFSKGDGVGKLKVGKDDFSFLLKLSDNDLSKRLDLIRKEQVINGKQYLDAKKRGDNTSKIEESGKNLSNQENAIIQARIRVNKFAGGGGVGEHKLKYSLNNVYMSTLELRGVDFKRASVVIYNSKNLNLTSDLLNKIKDLIQSYSGSSVVKALKNENKDYYFAIENKMIAKKSNEFNDELEKLMNANNFYLADVNLLKQFSTGVFWSGELNEDYFDLWAFLMNLKNFAKQAETRDRRYYEKVMQAERNYINATYRTWAKENREAELNKDIKKYEGTNQKIWKASLYENGGAVKHSMMSTGGAAKKNGVNQFAEDEKSEGYEAKVFLGKFDGRTFKAQSTDKIWDDGTPVTKYFSRNGFKDVKLKGEYQLVDSDRGHWYIQGPRNVWYAVRHKDYGTPPFEFGKGGMMPGWKHKAKK